MIRSSDAGSERDVNKEPDGRSEAGFGDVLLEMPLQRVILMLKGSRDSI